MCGEQFYAGYKGQPYCVLHYTRITKSPEDDPGPADRLRFTAPACEICGGTFRRYIAGVACCESCSGRRRYDVDREREVARNARYRDENRALLNARSRENSKLWRSQPENRLKERAAQAAWRAKNRVAVRGQGSRRYARQKGAVSAAWLTVILTDPCAYCGAKGTSIDHIIALKDGGPHEWSNLTTACKSCNSSKGTRPLLTFLLSRNAVEPSGAPR